MMEQKTAQIYKQQSSKGKIESIRDALKGGYTQPDPELVKTFREDLKTSDVGISYLKGRGLSDDTIEHFKLGYDKTKNAISIPVYKRGELINLRYRFINPEDGPKYTQTKGCEVWLYNDEGLSIGLKKRGVLIVEGEFDLMSAWQAGFKNVVSPASGKDSYGVWLEQLDAIAKVYIAYDNDKAGKGASKAMADRIGVDKSFEILYPDDIKDANDFFLKNTKDDFVKLIREARPFYKYKFTGVADILKDITTLNDNTLKLDLVPFIEFEEDWLVLISGDSNVGKTTYVMNIANELMDKNIPTLVFPFERGIRTVGKRFIQTRYEKTKKQLKELSDSDVSEMMLDAVNLPLYFATGSGEEVPDLIARAKRIFNTKVIIVDHLNYLVRQSSANENVETNRMLMKFKAIAMELGVIVLLVHHINKPEKRSGAPKRPTKEDLKGSSSLYQDPEAVIMLHAPEIGELEVIIEKNKGEHGFQVFDFNTSTGKIKLSDISKHNEEVEKEWDKID